ALSVFGRPAGGAFADGVSRVAYSEADVAGRRYVIDLMLAAGLDTRIDPAGNIFGRRAGTDSSLPPVLFGSHIDSVPSGGNFDGDLGSLAALGVIEACDRANHRTRHPLQMVVWSAEEGVAFGRGLAGSRIVAGDVKPADMDAVWNGLRRSDAVRKIGGDPDRVMDAVRPKGAHHCYLELHIEQGGTLWQRNIRLGIVEGIVGIDRYRVVLEGFANHAGTTPMNQRRDALVTAAKIILAVRETVTAEPGRQVGTVGYVRVEPGAPNVIPGRVEFPVEIRDLSMEKIKMLAERVRSRAADLAAADNVGFTWELTNSHEGALTDRRIRGMIQKAAEEMRVVTLTMPSGAGHDAQSMARLCPMGMIFVPSRDGISHSPQEYSRSEEVACGCEALYRTILRLDALERFT
ncbi:MAG TPA: M20 family metallo-hydrolase, partial [Candidatus Acidoferrales bacterium]|nr:M20 family metallo-hydrolase [Candidatus Acidoferrales bacterium]